jgi:hypothetical protein
MNMKNVEPKTKRTVNVQFFADKNGQECSIQKSNASIENCIWLGVDEPDVFYNEKRGYLPPDVKILSRMLLSQQDVRDLLPMLLHFAETGKL